MQAQAADASAVLSDALGRQVVLERAQSEQRNKAEIDPTTVFGDLTVEQAAPDLGTTTLPDFFPLPPGTFFDSASIHVLASSSLAHVERLIGDDAQLDARRFRPNILVETDPVRTALLRTAGLRAAWKSAGRSGSSNSSRPAVCDDDPPAGRPQARYADSAHGRPAASQQARGVCRH